MNLPQHPRIKPLTLEQILARKPPGSDAVGADATVLDALRVMAERDIGAVLVLDGERVAGLFSERDFARHAVAAGGAVSRLTPVRDAMATGVACATAEHTVPECLELMARQRLRHLPVVERGRAIGVLSLDDVLREVVAHQERVLKAIELDRLVLFARGTYSC